MKIDGDKWLEWLHEYRAAQEHKRRELGVDEVEWMKQRAARAREILTRRRECQGQPVVRDRPRRPKTRKP